MLDKKVLRELFPLPAGTKLRKPRFGKVGPSEPGELPPCGEAAASDQPSFSLHWKDEKLGVEVNFRIKEDNLVAYVTCYDAAQLGQAVSVFLKGSIEGRLLRKTVALSTLIEEGCGGMENFGKLEDIARTLGASLSTDAYLLVSE